jgi:triphosphatase
MLNQRKPTTPAPIASGLTADEAIVTLLSGLQAELVAALRAALDRPAPDEVHALRIALRRLRAGLAICRDWSETTCFDAVEADAHELADTLGAARNWDVLVTETLPRHATELAGIVDLAPLAEAAHAARDVQYRRMLDRLDGPQPQKLLLGLALLLSGHPWRKPDGSLPRRLADPAEKRATKALARGHRRQLRRGKRFASLSDRERHRLRIAAKRQTYAMDMLGPIWGKPGKQRAYRRSVKDLQAALGALNDIETTRGLLDALAADTPAPALHRAIGAVAGWSARDKREKVEALGPLWRAFRKARPFW